MEGIFSFQNKIKTQNSLKQLTLLANSPWVYIREGLLSEGYLRLRFRRLIFRMAYFWRGLLLESYGICGDAQDDQSQLLQLYFLTKINNYANQFSSSAFMLLSLQSFNLVL